MCDAGCDAGPLSSIVRANFLASGWFVQLAHSCYLSKSAKGCTIFVKVADKGDDPNAKIKITEVL